MLRAGVAFWLAAGGFGFAVVPWNAIGGAGFLAFNWWASYPWDARVAPAAVELAYHGRWWLLPLVAALALPIWAARTAVADRRASRVLLIAGLTGLATIATVAAAIDIGGWTWAPLASLFGTL